MLNIGDAAIDFLLKNQDGKDIRLSEFAGKKVVLYFYPKDNTPGCTTEACGLRDVYDEILVLGAVVLGVSADSETKHINFRNKYNLPFHLLVDSDHETAKAYGAWDKKKMFGNSFLGIKRITYIIDGNGVIRNTWSKVSPSIHANEILDALKSLV